MPEIESSNELLTRMLAVLQRIDDRIALQDRHIDKLNSLVDSPKTDQSCDNAGADAHSANTAAAVIPPLSGQDHAPHELHKGPKIRYRDWSLSQLGGHLDDEISNFLQTYIGDWCKIPSDNRLPLAFSRYGRVFGFAESAPSNTEAVYYRPAHYALAMLEAAYEFDKQLRDCHGNDFLVVDFDSQNHHILYRLREVALGNEILVPDIGDDTNAPWSRLILYQGMTTGNSINPDTRVKSKGLKAPVPYFDQNGGGPGLWSHINSFLQHKGRNITTNPYLDVKLGFTTTFYEILKDSDQGYHELWRHGPLYDDPLGRSFRKCSYTIYGLSSTCSNDDPEINHTATLEHWTILLLTPSHFFDQSNTSFPTTKISAEDKDISGHFVGRLSKLGAEMNLIAQGLLRISERWADFQSFFEFILDSGDSLMQPAKHDNLLFDDGAFSRSRRYFWAIDCLSEFDHNISDNLTQWELWKSARVEELLKKNNLCGLDLQQYKSAEQQYRVLLNQREYFRQKLASTIALRDALFNASAVIESRASTRLGENVKLLTFVSIFFLPLSFCTSLFSTTGSVNALLPTILSVGIATYLIVLNINTLVRSSHALYNSQKHRLIRTMKADESAAWRERGKRFEVFKPKHESVRPSEWYMPLYAILRIGKLGRLDAADQHKRTQAGSARNDGWLHRSAWWSFRQHKAEVPLREDEGWVL